MFSTATWSPRALLKPMAALVISSICFISAALSGCRTISLRLRVLFVSLASSTRTTAETRLMVPGGCVEWRSVRLTAEVVLSVLSASMPLSAVSKVLARLVAAGWFEGLAFVELAFAGWFLEFVADWELDDLGPGEAGWP